jgi:hypothetical protein
LFEIVATDGCIELRERSGDGLLRLNHTILVGRHKARDSSTLLRKTNSGIRRIVNLDLQPTLSELLLCPDEWCWTRPQHRAHRYRGEIGAGRNAQCDVIAAGSVVQERLIAVSRVIARGGVFIERPTTGRRVLDADALRVNLF